MKARMKAVRATTISEAAHVEAEPAHFRSSARCRRGGKESASRASVRFGRTTALPTSTNPLDLGLTACSSAKEVEQALRRLETSNCSLGIRVLNLHGVQVRGEQLMGRLVALLRKRRGIHSLNLGEQDDRAQLRPCREDVRQLTQAVERSETGLVGVYVDDTASRGEARRQLQAAVRENRLRLQDRAKRAFQRTAGTAADEARVWTLLPWRHGPSREEVWKNKRARRAKEGEAVADGQLGFRLEAWSRSNLLSEPSTPAGRWA